MNRLEAALFLGTTCALLPLNAAAAIAAVVETQRLEWPLDVAALPPDVGYGARVALPHGPSGWAFVGGPAAGAVQSFRLLSEGWASVSTSQVGSPQTLAMTSLEDRVLRTEEELNGPELATTVRNAANLFALVSTTGPPVEAIASDAVSDTAVLVIGQPTFDGGAGRVRIYELDENDDFALVKTMTGDDGDLLGTAVAIHGSLIAAGAPGRGDNGAVKIYARLPDWTELQDIPSPATSQTGAEFGASVALGSTILVVGSPLVDKTINPGARTDVGAAYVYRTDFLLFELTHLLRPPGAWHEDHIGTDVGLYDFGVKGLVVAIGAPGEDQVGSDEGAVHLYREQQESWSHLARLIDSTGEPGDHLGSSLALGVRGLLAGAPDADVDGVTDRGTALFFDAASVLPLFMDGFESGGLSHWSSGVL